MVAVSDGESRCIPYPYNIFTMDKTMDKRSVAPLTTTPPNEESLPKRRASGEVDCCVPRKRLVCPPPSPTTTCAKSAPWRFTCDVCGFYSRYFYKAEECERMHFGPLITTPTDDIDERDDDDDDNGWFVGGVTTRSPTLIPPGTPYPSPLEQPTPPTVSSSDSEDVEVKATVDGGHIAAAAAEKNLHTKPKVSQSPRFRFCALRSLPWRSGSQTVELSTTRTVCRLASNRQSVPRSIDSEISAIVSTLTLASRMAVFGRPMCPLDILRRLSVLTSCI